MNKVFNLNFVSIIVFFCISILPLCGMESSFSEAEIIELTEKEHKIFFAQRVQNSLNEQQSKLNKHSYKFSTQNSIDSFQDRINSAQKLLNQNKLHQIYRASDETDSICMDLDDLIQIIANRRALNVEHKTNTKLKKSQDKAWKKTLSYLSAAGIFTGIGLYSYYKLSEQLQWCRPALIGLSVFGGATCSILAYKNLKTLISKKTY